MRTGSAVPARKAPVESAMATSKSAFDLRGRIGATTSGRRPTKTRAGQWCARYCAPPGGRPPTELSVARMKRRAALCTGTPGPPAGPCLRRQGGFSGSLRERTVSSSSPNTKPRRLLFQQVLARSVLTASGCCPQQVRHKWGAAHINGPAGVGRELLGLCWWVEASSFQAKLFTPIRMTVLASSGGVSAWSVPEAGGGVRWQLDGAAVVASKLSSGSKMAVHCALPSGRRKMAYTGCARAQGNHRHRGPDTDIKLLAGAVQGCAR